MADVHVIGLALSYSQLHAKLYTGMTSNISVNIYTRST